MRPATTGVEKTLTAIWQSVLCVPHVCLDDDFFELGGTSLGAIKVLLAIKEQLGISLDMSLWADVATIAGFAGACSVLTKQLIAGHKVGPVFSSNQPGDLP